MCNVCAKSSTDLRLASAEARTEIVRRLTICDSLLLVSHDRPDGDALGSMIALARAARARGKQAEMALTDPLPRRYAFLADGEDFLAGDALAAAAAAAELIVIVDTCTWGQLEGARSAIEPHMTKAVVIDHHQSNEPICKTRWCDPSAAATGVQVTESLQRLAWPTDMRIGEALLAAICSDTGWLRFSNTDRRALLAAGHWIELGCDPSELYRKLYEDDRPQRLALAARLLSGLTLHHDDRLAVMTLTPADFEQTGAGPDETENLINEAMRIGSVEIAALLTDTGTGQIRVSLRSKRTVDVSALAETFGGGGHARAAGFRSDNPLDQTRDTLVAAAGKAL